MGEKQAKTILIVFVLTLIFAACMPRARLYEGPKLPKHEIAFVTMDKSLGVNTVDGLNPVSSFMRTMTLEVLPGMHTIVLYCVADDGIYSRVLPEQSITLTAEAGKSYHIYANVTRQYGHNGKNYSWYPSIAEIADK